MKGALKITLFSILIFSFLILFLLLDIYKANAQFFNPLYLYVLRNPNDTSGIQMQPTYTSDIYQAHLHSTVKSGTLFRMIIADPMGQNTPFAIRFINQQTGASTTYTGTCSQLGGKYDMGCKFEGMFQLTNPNNNYEVWSILYFRNPNNLQNANGWITVIVVNPNYNSFNNKKEQFRLLALTQNNVETTTISTTPSSTISFLVESNKAFCPTDLAASGKSTIDPVPIKGIVSSFTIRNSDFMSGDSRRNDISFSGVATGTYNLYLLSNAGNQVSNPVSIIVQESSTGRYRCFLGFCQYYDTTRGRWVNTSTDVCRNNGLICTPGAIRE